MQDILAELRQLTSRASTQPTETGIPGVVMIKGKVPQHQLNAVYEPMLSLVLQGRKSLTIGDQLVHCDPLQYFVLSVDLPAAGIVQQGEAGQPYQSVALSLRPELILSVLDVMPKALAEGKSSGTARGFSVSALSPELLDAWLRLLRLIPQPQDIPVLAPVYTREIIYRALQGPQGGLLREIARPESSLGEIRRAVEQMRSQLATPFRVEDLANMLGMSESVFYRQFKRVTGQSPIQFQKQLRLLEARKMLIAQAQPVATAAFSVGYESLSQFNRDYTRSFGSPPARDAARIRETIAPRA